MIRATQIALLAFLIVATLAVAAVGWASYRLIAGMDAQINAKTGILARAEGLETKANATLINLDKGTAVWAASAKDQAGAVEDLATDAHGTLGQANMVLESAHGDLEALHRTADASTESVQELTETIKVGKRTIARATPVLEALEDNLDASQQAIQHFDALIQSPNLSQALAHVNSMTASGDGILADAKKVADKETADWLKPVPWWKAPIAKGGQLIDITAAIARHAP